MPNPSTLTTNGGTITHIVSTGSAGVWTTDCGTLWTDSGATLAYSGGSAAGVYFKAQNITSTGTVSCSGNGSTSVTITAEMPSIPNFPHKWQPDKRGIITNVKRDGSVNGRILGTGTLVRDMTLTFRNRSIAEYQIMETFVANHYPHGTFKYNDLLLNINNTYRFVSPLKVTAQGFNRIDFEVDIAEVG